VERVAPFGAPLFATFGILALFTMGFATSDMAAYARAVLHEFCNVRHGRLRKGSIA
jgi:hypothetical protein